MLMTEQEVKSFEERKRTRCYCNNMEEKITSFYCAPSNFSAPLLIIIWYYEIILHEIGVYCFGGFVCFISMRCLEISC